MPHLPIPSVWTLVFPALLLAAWIAVYLIWLRPWLLKYQLTAGIVATIEADEAAGLHWIALKLKGAWSAILLFLTSILTGSWGLIEELFGIDPSALAPFQDSSIWKWLLQDEMAIRAAAVATFASAILVLKGKLHDVKVVPLAPPAASAAAPETPAPTTVAPAAPSETAAPAAAAIDAAAAPKVSP